ncbi:PBSX family phage terminase large subunit [Borrelia sp. A-FGy1]|uniref:PBSX family phage terminase large subunit n=1 Tax=Borrelia sp. A-FGy1 TaxID=2608247 RepID=UPI001E2CF2DF|nr:PBSX family phage terminase large subunit [Borrelia sp. A-FGy1]
MIEFKRLPVYHEAYKRKPEASIYIYYSSRGTGKTYDIATVNLERKFSAFGGDTLAIRKKKNKTLESIHKEILELLDRYSLRRRFTISKARIQTKDLVFGKKRAFVFEGGHDTTDLKSYAHFKDLWIEEANQFSDKDIEKLLPTLREQGGRVYMSSNPVPRSHWLYKRYIANQEDTSLCVIRSTYKDNPFLNGGNVKAWLAQQRLAYHGNDIGYRIEVLGEEFDFQTARLIKDFSTCDASFLERATGSFYTGVHVRGNRIVFIEVLLGRLLYLPITVVTNAASKVLLTRQDYASQADQFRGTFVLPSSRAELQYAFSKLGRGALLARARNLYALSDYLLPSNLYVLKAEQTEDVITEFSNTEYYYDETSLSQDGSSTNLVMQQDLEYIPAFLNVVSLFA